MEKLVSAIFGDAQSAQRAVASLIDAHFNPDEISVVVADASVRHTQPVEHNTGVSEGLTIGSVLGGALGAAAALVATGIAAAPGAPVLASGPVLSALRGAVAGAGMGGLVGALAGLGFWHDEACLHAEAIRAGNVMVAVHAVGERAARTRELFQRTGAQWINT